jgi:hypothetical protein
MRLNRSMEVGNRNSLNNKSFDLNKSKNVKDRSKSARKPKNKNDIGKSKSTVKLADQGVNNTKGNNNERSVTSDKKTNKNSSVNKTLTKLQNIDAKTNVKQNTESSIPSRENRARVNRDPYIEIRVPQKNNNIKTDESKAAQSERKETLPEVKQTHSNSINMLIL